MVQFHCYYTLQFFIFDCWAELEEGNVVMQVKVKLTVADKFLSEVSYTSFVCYNTLLEKIFSAVSKTCEETPYLYSAG